MSRRSVATMHDVAALAGVSPRTVSNVVRGYVHVRPATRERVQRAIDDLRYRPNVSARSLREGRTGIIALALPEIAAPYFAELSDHIQREAAQRGVTLLIDQTGAEREGELLVLEGYRTHVIDGLILSPMAITEADLAGHGSDLPMVLLGERVLAGGAGHVGIDNVAAARAATQHLLDGGRRRIAAIGVEEEVQGPAVSRVRGYTAALEAAGLPVDPALQVATGGWFRGSGYRAVRDFVSGGTEVDALFCFNDVLAMAAMRALSDLGVRVPDDVAVVGWDDIEEAAYATPSLTTVAPDKAAIARAAVELLLDAVGGDEQPPREVVCGHRLVVRESSTGGRVSPGTAPG